MGMIRFFLAVCVVFTHCPWHGSGDYFLLNGRNSVQIFFMISGFLISYVLKNNPGYQRSRTFYLGRAFRIYPIYWVVAGAALVLSVATHENPVAIIPHMPWGARIALIVSNALILGQDWIMFSGINNGHFVFSTNFMHSNPPVFFGLVLSPAWSLDVELSFYLLAPFILKKRARVVSVLAVSLALRLAFFFMRPDLVVSDPWTYRFFPFEISLFMLGALSQDLMLPWWAGLQKKSIYASYGTAFFIAAGASMFLIPGNEFYKSLFLFCSFFACLPLAFIFQNDHKWDSALGELSYPIYVSHLLVLMTLPRILRNIYHFSDLSVTLFCVFYAIILASLLNRFIARPLEIYRKKITRTRKYPIQFDLPRQN